MKRLLAMALALSMVLTLAACGGGNSGGNAGGGNAGGGSQQQQENSGGNAGGGDSTASPVAGKKVAYIMIMPSATIFQMWANSCKDLAKALGADCDVFFCDGDFNKWQDTINTCAAGGYDGLLVSHGNQDGSYTFLKQVTEQYPNLKITCFDTQFYTDGQYQKIPGITQMFQQDASLVTVLLDDMIKNFGEGVRLIKVWRGPNYNSPFDRREVGWQEYDKAGKIVTVGEVQPLQDTVDSANTVFAAYLQSISRDAVDGTVVYYDCYGQGVYQAIVENANFNGTNGAALPMGSVDIDPVDITNMKTRPDIWTAAGTTDWTLNGEIGMRILMLEIAGEYDKIYDPASGQYGVDVVEVPGSAILASALKDSSTVENLGEIADETYGNLNYLSVADWMPADLIH